MRTIRYVMGCDSAALLLNYAIENEIKPNDRFCKLAGDFKNHAYAKYRKNEFTNEEAIKYKKFYGKYKEWREHFELNSGDLSEEHPWKQYKDSQQDGIEKMKNPKLRRLWKRTHVVAKLNPTYLERIHSEKHQTKQSIQPKRKNQSKQTSSGDVDENHA